MATVRVAYKRTFQVKSYESQTIDLAIEAETADLQKASALVRSGYKELERIGDELMAEALAKPDPRDVQKPDPPRPGRPR